MCFNLHIFNYSHTCYYPHSRSSVRCEAAVAVGKNPPNSLPRPVLRLNLAA
jgi:hypothetical protein